MVSSAPPPTDPTSSSSAGQTTPSSAPSHQDPVQGVAQQRLAASTPRTKWYNSVPLLGKMIRQIKGKGTSSTGNTARSSSSVAIQTLGVADPSSTYEPEVVLFGQHSAKDGTEDVGNKQRFFDHIFQGDFREKLNDKIEANIASDKSTLGQYTQIPYCNLALEKERDTFMDPKKFVEEYLDKVQAFVICDKSDFSFDPAFREEMTAIVEKALEEFHWEQA